MGLDAAQVGTWTGCAESVPLADRTAVLVIRAWPDDGSAAGFRARITQVPHTSEPQETTVVVDTAEAVQVAVRQLLDVMRQPR